MGSVLDSKVKVGEADAADLDMGNMGTRTAQLGSHMADETVGRAGSYLTKLMRLLSKDSRIFRGQ